VGDSLGREIKGKHFSDNDEKVFAERLRNETKILMGLFQNNSFEKFETPMCGLEIEAWLVDQDFLPSPVAEPFLNDLSDPLVVPEISKFNFEINTDPLPLQGNVFNHFHQNIEDTWKKIQLSAKEYNSRALSIGSLPTLRKNMLSLDHLYPNKRYFALNKRILDFRRENEFKLEIKGREEISESFKSIMLEAAATSFQIHLQVPQEKARDFYNCSILASPFMAAICANSPFLFGKDLWSETRIPIFEQSICTKNYKRKEGRWATRVTLGNGYVKESLFELFLDNLDGYPPLLPELLDDEPSRLAHLRLHNGTIWRWNRPILGFNNEGVPHLRIEHRVPPSGPTTTDMVANMAFYIGLTHFLVDHDTPLWDEIPFETARENFYGACKNGLSAQIKWRGKEINIQKAMLDIFIPGAKNALLKLGVHRHCLERYFDDVLVPRALAGQNGSSWQQAFISTHGHRYQELLEEYYSYQEQDIPVHNWKCPTL
jgi:gamma-glutamyl:cysteine ligase YbdK (ATP-grasp superfamily)